MKNSLLLFLLIISVWTLFRVFSPHESSFDELVVKPIVFLVPTAFFCWREKLSLQFIGIDKRSVLRKVGYGAVAGLFLIGYEFFIHQLKGQPTSFISDPLVIFSGLVTSLATAISEEIVFRGYMLNKILQTTRNAWLAIGMSTLFFVLTHIPRSILVLHMTNYDLAIYCFLLTFLGIINGLLVWKTRNIGSSIATHTLWNAYLAITR